MLKQINKIWKFFWLKLILKKCTKYVSKFHQNGLKFFFHWSVCEMWLFVKKIPIQLVPTIGFKTHYKKPPHQFSITFSCTSNFSNKMIFTRFKFRLQLSFSIDRKEIWINKIPTFALISFDQHPRLMDLQIGVAMASDRENLTIDKLRKINIFSN